VGPDGKLHDTKALIPDRCYAGIYQEVIDDCRKNGAFDVPTMGNVSNVGLMAQAAEEYGLARQDVRDSRQRHGPRPRCRRQGAHGARVEQGDIWRMCRTIDLPIRDWVKLAVNRARATGQPAIFWLDENRAYDRNLIDKVGRLPARPRHNGLEH
jgi:isocitrate dehydrogenase